MRQTAGPTFPTVSADATARATKAVVASAAARRIALRRHAVVWVDTELVPAALVGVVWCLWSFIRL